MRRKIPIIMVLTLMMSSIFVGATTVTKDDDYTSMSMSSWYGYHQKFLYPPWHYYGCYTIPMQGDVEVTATSDNLNGYAQSKCEFDTVLQQRTEEGKAGFDHYFEWTSPVTTDSAHAEFHYYISYEIKMYSSWGTQGDEAEVRIGILFFVDDNSKYEDVIHWAVQGGIDHEWSDARTRSQVIPMSLQKGKTYNIGVQVFAYSWATAFSGYILSRATVSHQKQDSRVIIRWEDQPPEKPDTPSGPTKVNLWRNPNGVTCTYSTYTTDPDMEDVEYQWWFGDGTGYYPSQTEWLPTPSVQHTWKTVREKPYEVKVKARGTSVLLDGFPAESEWSESIYVSVVRQRSRDISSPLLLRFIERFTGNFPLLQQLLQNLR